MQSVFRKYITIAMGAAMVAVLILCYIFNAKNTRVRQAEAFNAKLDRIVATLEQNQTEVENLEISLEEDYLTRARAFAYIIEKNPSVLQSQAELTRISENLDVDELHVFDSEGVIRYSSVPQYVGMSYKEGEQIGEFYQILEQDDPDFYVIQEARPNTAEGKIIQYVGVPRIDEKGIVQVGLKPTRLIAAQKRNTYAYIFEHIPTDINENLFAINMDEGCFVGHTLPERINTYLSSEGHHVEDFLGCDDGAFRVMAGVKKYVVTREYGSILLGASIPRATLYETLLTQMLQLFAGLALTWIVVIWVLNHFLKNKIVLGIHRILDGLDDISMGNLDRTVEVKDVPEFAQLSIGINGMVESILGTTVKLSRIIELTGYPLGAYECRNDMSKVVATEQLKDILHIEAGQAAALYESKDSFLAFMQKLTETPADGEKDIYRLTVPQDGEHKDYYIRVQNMNDVDGWFGVVCDVTEEYTHRRRVQYERDHDALTGLKNYRRFAQAVNERLKDMLEEEQLSGVCAGVMLDLDHFKAVNDQYGHDFGDSYLKHFSALLQLLSADHILICRRSGDEFGMFLFGMDSTAAVTAVLEKLQELTVENPIIYPDGHSQNISVSAGIALMADINDTFDTIMARADQALYGAKTRARGTYHLFSNTL